MMTSADVVYVLDRLDRAAVGVWLDGGWGVDVLVGHQTRTHSDVDLAIARDDLTQAEGALEKTGFRNHSEVEPGLPARFVMIDQHAREVDFHPLVFDSAGNGWQQLSPTGRAWGCHDAEHLLATGTIDGRTVRCLSAELQLRFRRGYEWSDRDEHDIRLLTREFGLPALPHPPSAPTS
jgi:lincosamide nucleotidyltransferase A/C/D/E